MRILARTLLAALLATGTAWLTGTPAAVAGCHGGYGSANSGGGTVIGGSSSCSAPDDNDTTTTPYHPQYPPPPVYKDYWTPACSVNGPPGVGGDVMCMGAATICDSRGEPDAVFMRHYRQEVGTAGWEFVANECHGADDPVVQEPQVTQEMVLDQAYAAAPRPTATVQPGNRSYVNLPNNYYADASGSTQTVNVLGHPITLTFTVNEVTWDFGDGQSGSGEGVEDADVGAPGAVEHAYGQQGSYQISAGTTVGVRFTLPDGQAVDLPDAFAFTSQPVTLPVGEIQTRVDATS